MEKKINVSINDGTSFFSHEASINFSPTQFIFDFRSVTPRVDPRSTDSPTIHLVHNVVMLEPFHAKRFHELLGEMISKYEKDFEKIDKPKAIKLVEKRSKKESKAEEVQPNYFG